MEPVNVRHDPLSRLDDMQRRMERLMDHLAAGKRQQAVFCSATWSPAVDLYETSDSLVLVADLAGLKLDEVDLVVDAATVLLRGARPDRVRGQRERFHLMEVSRGPFERTVALPVPIDTSRVEATYCDGLLEIVLPKQREPRQGRIAIRSSE